MEVVRRHLPAGIPEPRRRDDPVPPAAPRGDGHDRRDPAEAAGAAAGRSQDRARRWTRRRVDWLADKGYDPAYGARPLKRVIQKELQDPLAEKILLGDILDGSTRQGHRRFRPAELPAETGPWPKPLRRHRQPARKTREWPPWAAIFMPGSSLMVQVIESRFGRAAGRPAGDRRESHDPHDAFRFGSRGRASFPQPVRGRPARTVAQSRNRRCGSPRTATSKSTTMAAAGG